MPVVNGRVPLDNTLGEFLANTRKKHELPQRRVAPLIGVSTGYIGLIEIGERMITMESMLKYAELFNVTVDQLMRKRIETVRKTVELYGANSPTAILNEYHLANYYNLGTTAN